MTVDAKKMGKKKWIVISNKKEWIEIGMVVRTQHQQRVERNGDNREVQDKILGIQMVFIEEVVKAGMVVEEFSKEVEGTAQRGRGGNYLTSENRFNIFAQGDEGYKYVDDPILEEGEIGPTQDNQIEVRAGKENGSDEERVPETQGIQWEDNRMVEEIAEETLFLEYNVSANNRRKSISNDEMQVNAITMISVESSLDIGDKIVVFGKNKEMEKEKEKKTTEKMVSMPKRSSSRILARNGGYQNTSNQ